ncbi:MAG: sigma-54-dependent transcriptional regulator [Candidatus Latescibacterota bacterium]
MSQILIVDDNETLGSGIALMLQRMDHQATAVLSGAAGIEHLGAHRCDLVITDYRMEGMDGMQVLQKVKERWPDTDVMMMTAHGTIEIAVEAMKRGAIDFITKPFPHDALRLKVQNVLEYRQARQERSRLGEENRYLREEIDGRYNFGEVVGDSESMRSILGTVQKVASSDSSVLVYGESGTGKELVARALHYQSNRGEGPFVKVNCGALPHELFESELFGHEKGAFTGAVRQKKGKFELAEGGTIFLDEIGDVPLDAQVKLLRVLQERQYDRVGGEQTLEVDVRVVAATNRDLRNMMAEGAFREDLFYRLEVIPFHLPPLRERREDVPLLVDHFMKKKCREMNIPLKRLHDEALRAFCSYPWPGNVRELENVIERTIVLSDRDTISLQDVPIMIDDGVEGDIEAVASASDEEEAIAEPRESLALNERMDEMERSLIVRAMDEAGRVKTRAAELLGIKTSALYYKLDKHGIE